MRASTRCHLSQAEKLLVLRRILLQLDTSSCEFLQLSNPVGQRPADWPLPDPQSMLSRVALQAVSRTVRERVSCLSSSAVQLQLIGKVVDDIDERKAAGSAALQCACLQSLLLW